MNTAAEFKAALPKPHVILGLRLLPLSLGRYRLLQRLNCPFVADGEKELDGDNLATELFCGLVVCGLTCAEFKRLLDTGKLARECARFGRRAKKFMRREEHFSLLESAAQFQSYLDDGTALPWKVIPRGSRESTGVAHWSHSIAVILRSRVGWKTKEIDEAPMAEALCQFFSFMESEGAVSLVTHEEFAEIEKTGSANADILLAFERAAQKGTN